MMLGRQSASVEEGRVGVVDEGNERGRDGTRHGRREGGHYKLCVLFVRWMA